MFEFTVGGFFSGLYHYTSHNLYNYRGKAMSIPFREKLVGFGPYLFIVMQGIDRNRDDHTLLEVNPLYGYVPRTHPVDPSKTDTLCCHDNIYVYMYLPR